MRFGKVADFKIKIRKVADFPYALHGNEKGTSTKCCLNLRVGLVYLRGGRGGWATFQLGGECIWSMAW